MFPYPIQVSRDELEALTEAVTRLSKFLEWNDAVKVVNEYITALNEEGKYNCVSQLRVLLVDMSRAAEKCQSIQDYVDIQTGRLDFWRDEFQREDAERNEIFTFLATKARESLSVAQLNRLKSEIPALAPFIEIK